MPTTTERGLGSEHQKLRRQLLPLAYGKPCPKCGNQMLEHADLLPPEYRWLAMLELDHVWPRAVAGPNNGGPRVIMHRKCNRQAGARLGNALKKARRPQRQIRSRW